MRVMIVDSEADTRHLFRRLLEDMGHKVINWQVGQNLGEFMAKDDSEIPDLILLELAPRQTTCLDMVQQIRANKRWGRVPILLTTTIPRGEQINEVIKSGAIGVLPKPINIQMFEKSVDSVLCALP